MLPPKELQIIQLQRLGTDIARDAPTYGTQPKAYGDATGTVRTGADWQIYCAMSGVLGPEGRKLVWDTAIKRPDIALPVPYDDITRQFMQMSPELARNDSGFMHQKVPQVSSPKEKRYKNDVYSYAKYERAAYFKSTTKAAYGKAKEEIKSAVAKVYNAGREFFRKASGQGNLEQILSTA